MIKFEDTKIFDSTDKLIEFIKKCKEDIERNEVSEKFIVRTYSAGVFFGEISKEDRMIVTMKDSRRLWEFCCKKGIELSDVAINGLDESKSRVSVSAPYRKIEAIEIIKASDECIKSINSCPDAKPN